jgi:hypothetical protein
MEAVIVAVITIFVVAGAIEVIVGGRGRGVPILKLNETDADEIPQHRHVIMDDLMRAKVEGRPAVVLLLRLRRGHNDLIRNQVGVRAPRGHKELPLVIGVSKCFRIRCFDLGAGGPQDGLGHLRRPRVRGDALQPDEDAISEGARGGHDEAAPAPPPQRERSTVRAVAVEDAVAVVLVGEPDVEVVRPGSSNGHVVLRSGMS